MINSLADNRLAHWWNLSPAAALAKGIEKFGGNVLVESGPTFLDQLVLSKDLDGIYLSITKVVGGENPINITDLLDKFSEVSRTEIEGTIFIEAKTLR
jgi:riboflavin biosynthesis pyrimidine reductase